MPVRLLLVALAYFATGWLGLKMPYLGQNITLVWLPTGIAVAALYRWGRPVWPSVFVASFLVNLSVGSTWSMALGIAIGNTLAPLLAAEFLRIHEFHATFDRRRDVGLFTTATAMGMLVSATGGTACLYLAGVVPTESIGAAWLFWWMGDSVGVLLAGPLLLSISRKNLIQFGGDRKALLLWLMFAIPAAWFAFVHDYVQMGRSLPLAFLTFPLFAWAALRFRITGAALAGLAFSVVAAWSTAKGHGTFWLPNTNVGLMLLWTYMASTVLTGLLITAMQAEHHQAESTLRESEQRFSAAFSSSPVAASIATAADGRFIESNENYERDFGWTKADLIGKTSVEVGIWPDSATREPWAVAIRREGRLVNYETIWNHKNGERRHVSLSAAITELNGESCILAYVTDITARKQAEQVLAASETRLRAVLNGVQSGVVVIAENGIVESFNRSAERMFALNADEVIGQNVRLLIPEPFKTAHDGYLHNYQRTGIGKVIGKRSDVVAQRKDGSTFPIELGVTEMLLNGTRFFIGSISDITERKSAEERINELAFFDQLTRLPNRTLLLDRLRQAMTTGARNASYGSLLFIDLDNFKTLNDTAGHDIGDLLLQQVAVRIAEYVREGDTVARLGGDEFVVVIESLSTNAEEAATQTEAVGEKILAALNGTYQLNATEYRSSASIGATLFKGHQTSIDDLMKQADLAMYKSKQTGRNALHFFDPAMQTLLVEKAALESSLRRAIDEHQFLLHYQAQVVGTGRVTGAEALVRWQHPEFGIMPPADFIPLAEETGLILPLGEWVLNTACAQLAHWAIRPEMSHLTIAVNVSAKEFCEPDYVPKVLAILNQTGANPKKLKLELTESLLVNNIEDVIEKMFTLRAKGVGFSLDDFGTGYSSLSYLKRMPLDQLKIDQSFVRDVLVDPNDAAIARTVVALAHSLGLGVIAEGVETEAQRVALAESGCHAYQGYLFSKPLPVEAFEAYSRLGR
ncbi:MAG: EAL domain-containing protein [Rhodoferax sp.]|nr:EAL domain-containing protein [Rhodoferax sp.]